jgi:hypothetical protein
MFFVVVAHRGFGHYMLHISFQVVLSLPLVLLSLCILVKHPDE